MAPGTLHLVGTWVVLLLLTGVAVGVGSLPAAGWGPALSILVASVKALLVAGVFMRLARGPNSPRLVFATAVLMLLLLVSLVALDVRTRPFPEIVPPDVRPMQPASRVPGERAAGEEAPSEPPDQPAGSG